MSDETKKPNSYTSEFKESAIKLAIESEQAIAQTARDLGINVNTLHTWIGKYSKPKVASSRTDDHIYDENKRLKKELALAIQERDLLQGALGVKKATAYFAREIR
jgi:transposase